MTGLKVTALASVLMLTAGSMAWAQNSTTNLGTQGNVNNPSAASTQNSTINAGKQGEANTSSSSVWNQSPPSNITADTQQKIRQSLEQSGFKNVQVLPQAFLIRAQAPDGSHIAMWLSPDQMTEVVTGNTKAGTSGSSLQPNGAQSNSGNNTMPSER